MFRMTQLSTLVYKYVMKKKFSSLFLLLFILSCASPKVVNVYGPNDSSLSCEELSNEIAIANEYANKAQEAKKKPQVKPQVAQKIVKKPAERNVWDDYF